MCNYANLNSFVFITLNLSVIFDLDDLNHSTLIGDSLLVSPLLSVECYNIQNNIELLRYMLYKCSVTCLYAIKLRTTSLQQ